MSYFKLLQKYNQVRKYWATTGQALCRAAGVGDSHLAQLDGLPAWEYFINNYVSGRGEVRV